MFRQLLLSFLLCCFAITFGTSPSIAKTRSAPLAVFHLEPHPGGTFMMTITARVRGHQGRVIFDTGGGVTYVSPAFAQTVGCKSWGQITGFMLTGQRLDMQRCDGLAFDIQGRSFAASTVGLYDIMKFMPPNVPRIDGSIGLDLFSGRAVTLNLAEKTLTLESPASLKMRRKRGKEVPIRIVREAQGIALTVAVGAITPQGTAWMELDSGNGGANVIGKHIAPLFDLKSGTRESQPASIMLVGGIPVTGDWRVNDTLTMDGNIGTRFLVHWALTLDLARGRAWLAPV